MIDSPQFPQDNYGWCGNRLVRKLPETTCITDSISNGPVRQLKEVPKDGIDIVKNYSVCKTSKDSITGCACDADSQM